MGSKSAGPGLYEFLIEAELQQYYNALKNELKVQNVSQLKYVSEDDMAQIGMSRPEIRRLTKFFHKHCPQTYLAKMKKKLLQRREEPSNSTLQKDGPNFSGRTVRNVAPGRHIIQADAIVSHKTLGSGEFGTVQQGVWTNEEGERIQVAVKCLSEERMENNPVEFLKEAAIMHSVDHEHIVRLYGVVLDTTSLVLVTELAPLRSLLECLKEPSMRPNLTLQTLFDFSVQICDGMEYLESKRLIHRDLAARNILVFSKSKVKISDFGLSRALGVGKDYYQTNFNVNLKLPIAWCAPECINFLRFTSASDVWAYGVTLWEMFSYGFQPWAALTGQQILEAIDEPNYHRLERPESSPVEMYYQIMLKCWQHTPSDRPTFAQLLKLLPECKPEQVQAIRESGESGWRRDFLAFEPGDLITVIDKKATADDGGTVEWKGVLKCGKSGFFNPANTITYLGPSFPSMKESQHFQRNESRSSSLRKGRISADMISKPQGDLKHTGHVGPDGQFFGDIAFINTKCWVPRQVVPPYKPEPPFGRDEASGCSASALSATDPEQESAWRDTDPLLRDPSRVPLHIKNWKKLVLPGAIPTNVPSVDPELDHEYHEISDEENDIMGTCSQRPRDLGLSNPALSTKSQSPPNTPEFDKAFDLGPSLMDEVFGALEQDHAKCTFSTPSPFPHVPQSKKKCASVKPISSKDRKRLDTAIAIANELASRSMLQLDAVRSSASFDDISAAPSSPIHRRKTFGFLLGSSKGHERERRNYAQEAASIPDIQSTLSEEAKEAYNSLIEKPSSIGSLGILTPSFENKSSSFHFPEKCGSKKSAFFDNEPLSPPSPVPTFVEPSKMVHGAHSSTIKLDKTKPKGVARSHAKSESWSGPEPRAEDPPEVSEDDQDRNPLRLLRRSKVNNALPLPPKRSESFQPSTSAYGSNISKVVSEEQNQKPTGVRHHRKHPLLIPQKVPAPIIQMENKTPPPPPPKPQRQNLPPSQRRNSADNLDSINIGRSNFDKLEPPPLYENYEDNISEDLKSVRLTTETIGDLSDPPKMVQNSALSQSVPSERDVNGNQQSTRDHGTTQVTVVRQLPNGCNENETRRYSTDEVSNTLSCENGLDHVANEQQKSANGQNYTPKCDRMQQGSSTKVKTVQRILGSSASEQMCEWALDLCRDDSAHAVKLLRLRTLLPPALLENDIERVVSVLEMSHWDVARASDFLLNPANQKPRPKTSLRHLGRRDSSDAERSRDDTDASVIPTPKYIKPTCV